MKKRKIVPYVVSASLAFSLSATPVLGASIDATDYYAVETENVEETEEEESASEEVLDETIHSSDVYEESAQTVVETEVQETETVLESESATDVQESEMPELSEEIDTENADIEGAWTKNYLFALADGAEIPKEGSGISYLMDNIYMADTLEQIYSVYNDDELLYVEENSEVELFGDNNDLYYSKQKQYIQNVKADAFWNQEVGAAGVTVAVIDSGLYSNHVDFDQSRILPGYNYVNNNEDTRDTAGHGTQVAGVIAAVRNNGIGVSGLLDDVNILPMRISANSSSSPTIAVVSVALKDAVDKYDVQVVNMSIGQKKSSDTLEAAVKYAAENNVIMVAAAGNNGNDVLMYPAAYDEVISVGALDNENVVRDNSQKNESVFVTAPGENIYTTDVNNKYTFKSGTSYSAPFVSAMAAAAKAVNKNMTIDEFKELLKATSVDAGEEGYDTSYGYGIVNIDAFLNKLNGTTEATAANVTVAFKDTEGNELAPSKTVEVKDGKHYSVLSDTISGYKAVQYTVENAATKNGTFELNSTTEKLAFSEIQSGNAVVTYIYEKVQAVEPAGESFDVKYERAYGSTLADAFKAVAATPDGGYIAVGYTFGESTDPGWGYNITSEKYPNANNDAIMVKFDADCKVEWARNFGTSGVEVFEDVSVLSDGTVIAVGRAPYDFGTGKSTVSGYVVRLDDSRIPDDYEEIHVGGSAGDMVHAVEATADGGYVIAGRTSSYDSADWTKVNDTSTTSDAFIAKYDDAGDLVFSKCYSEVAGKRTYFNAVTVDNDGNIVAVGENQTAKNVYNSQIVKFNGQTGEVMWSRSEGSSLTEEPDNSVEGHTSAFDSVAVLSDGSYVVTGTTKTTGSTTGANDAKLLDDGSETPQNWGIAGEKDGIIVHYSKDGKVTYATNIGTAGGTVTLSGVKATPDGGYMVYGQTSDEIYGSDVYTWKVKGATDTIVLKYNANDALEWNQSYGTEGKGEWFNDILVKDNGEFVIVGETNRNSTDGKIDASIWTSYPVEGDAKSSTDTEEENVTYADGIYEGSGIGFNTDVEVVVSVKVEGGKIQNVELVSHKDTSSYMKKATALLKNIAEKQTTNVDTVTGATYSSRGLKRAAKDALNDSVEVAKMIESIENLPEATLENEAAIQAVAESYNGLDEAIKPYVTNSEKLQEALKALAELHTSYVLMNIPYDEFYKADINNDVRVDAFSSATMAKPKSGLAAGSYHANTDASKIDGVTFPVKVSGNVDLSKYKQVTDADSVELTTTMRGQTSTTTYAGKEALFENDTYAYYVLSETPDYYKELTVNEDGSLSFGKTVGNVTKLDNVTADLRTESRYGDYQLNLDGLTDTVPTSEKVYGVVVSTKEGHDYGMRHLENIWRVSELAWSTGFTTEVHGCATDSEHYKAMMGETINKVTYYTSKGIYEIDTELYVPVKFDYTLTVEDADVTAGKTDVVIENLPADYDAEYSVEGLDITVDDAVFASETVNKKVVLNFKEAANGNYKLVVSDQSGKYAPMTTNFTLTTSEMPAAFNQDIESPAVVAADGASAEKLANYLNNISAVTVNGKSYSVSGRGSVAVIDKQTGAINRDVTVNDEKIFGDEGKYEVSITSNSYTTPLTFTIDMDENDDVYAKMNIPFNVFYRNITPSVADNIDTVTTASVKGKAQLYMDAGTFYGPNANAINGVTIPVKMSKKVYNQIKDQVDAAAGNYYVGEVVEDPSVYLELVDIEDNQYNFSTPQGKEILNDTITITKAWQTKRRDIEITLEGEPLEKADSLYGGYVTTTDGTTYPLLPMESMYKAGGLYTIGWSLGDKLEQRNSSNALVMTLQPDIFKSMKGKTLDTMTLYTANGIKTYALRDSETGDAVTMQYPVPETEAPETEAPETEAPETEAPETKAPETEAPETKAPETEAPETKAPETEAPETKAPETEAPETKAPETEASDTKLDMTAIEKAIKAAEDLKEDDYTEKSWKTVQSTLKNAKKAAEAKKSQDDIDKAAKTLQAAMDKLVKKNADANAKSDGGKSNAVSAAGGTKSNTTASKASSSTGSASSTSSSGSQAPKTGDSTNVLGMFALLGVSGTGIVASLFGRRKKKNK